MKRRTVISLPFLATLTPAIAESKGGTLETEVSIKDRCQRYRHLYWSDPSVMDFVDQYMYLTLVRVDWTKSSWVKSIVRSYFLLGEVVLDQHDLLRRPEDTLVEVDPFTGTTRVALVDGSCPYETTVSYLARKHQAYDLRGTSIISHWVPGYQQPEDIVSIRMRERECEEASEQIKRFLESLR